MWVFFGQRFLLRENATKKAKNEISFYEAICAPEMLVWHFSFCNTLDNSNTVF